MTTPRIEEIKAEFQMFVPEDDGSAMDWLENTLAEAKQAGIDEAVEKINKLQRWADTDSGEAGMRAEEYGGWLDRDEVLEALQDNK